MAALHRHKYAYYYQVSQEILATRSSCSVTHAILNNLSKSCLIKAAEEDLENKDYQHCLNACQVIVHAKFNIEQYNERLWCVYYQAYLGLGDDENACIALERYLAILMRKSAQVAAPKYKAQMNEKIAKANVQLTEIQERLLKQSPLPVRAKPLPFVAELKRKNILLKADSLNQSNLVRLA